MQQRSPTQIPLMMYPQWRCTRKPPVCRNADMENLTATQPRARSDWPINRLRGRGYGFGALWEVQPCFGCKLGCSVRPWCDSGRRRISERCCHHVHPLVGVSAIRRSKRGCLHRIQRHEESWRAPRENLHRVHGAWVDAYAILASRGSPWRCSPNTYFVREHTLGVSTEAGADLR